MTSRAASIADTVAPAPAREARSGPLARGFAVPLHWLTLGLALASVGWVAFALAPGAAPAWPSVSLGVAALASSTRPGRPIPRGVGAFLAVLGILAGAAQIAVFWGIAQALP